MKENEKENVKRHKRNQKTNDLELKLENKWWKLLFADDNNKVVNVTRENY